jgi:acyl-CoA reductase-like NAD-dependent aldehyde dehydrogenase
VAKRHVSGSRDSGKWRREEDVMMNERSSTRTARLWIGGAEQEPAGGRYFEDRRPEDDSVYAMVAEGGAADMDRAVRAAHEAFQSYGRTTASEREAWLMRAALLFEERRDRFLEVLVEETGVPIRLCRFMHRLSTEMMRAAAGMPRWMQGKTLPTDVPGRMSLSLRAPLGVIAAIIPFNVPLIKGVRLSANALALGNTVVMLPSEEAPLVATMLAELYRDAGLPAGAFNVVTGFGHQIGDSLTTHPLVRMVTFTGSSRVGKHIHKLCAEHGKRVTLELGGKSPLVVLADADLDKAVAAAAHGTFTFQGQACIASSRIYVERPVFEQFVERYAATAQKLSMGDLKDPGTMIGPIISPRQRERVKRHLDDAIAKGARVATGGQWRGNRCEPTILTAVTPEMAVCAEETFGPVASVYPIDSAEEGLRRANDSVYGLSAAIFTSNLNSAMQFVHGVKSGMVHVNASSLHDEPHVPFGGVGESGQGREGSDADIEAMTEWKWVTIQLEGGTHA